MSDHTIRIESREHVLHRDPDALVLNRLNTLNLHELERAGDFPELANIAKSKEDHIRSLLGVFSQYLRNQQLRPLLVEFAILGDDTPFFLPYEGPPQQTFQSYIATERDILSQEERKGLLKAWTKAIRVPDRTRANFIVSNNALYGCFLIVAKFPLGRRSLRKQSVFGGDTRDELETDTIDDPCFMRVGKSATKNEDSSTLENAEARIHAYLKSVTDFLQNRKYTELLNKLGKARVMLIPFPRPSIEKEYLKSLDNPIEFFARWAGHSMPSSPKPGGCLFAIYCADSMPRQKVAKREFEFALFAQHMLILSALNEARLNLMRHNDALRTQSLEKFTHFLKPELRHIRKRYDRALASERAGDHVSSVLLEKQARDVFDNLQGIIDFAEDVATGRARNNQLIDFERLERAIQEEINEASVQALELLKLDQNVDHTFNMTYETSFSALSTVETIQFDGNPTKIFPPNIDKRERYESLGLRALRIAIGELARNALTYAVLQKKEKRATWTLLKTGNILNLVVVNECEDNLAKIKQMAVFLSDEYRTSNAISHLRLCIAGAGIKGIPKRPALFVRSLGVEDASSGKERVEVIWVLPIGRTVAEHDR
jgi:hypothetical protein